MKIDLQKPKGTYRIAHISDLHFAKASYGLCQFFSKRWIGNLNLIFFRNRQFDPRQLDSLPDLFKQMHVDCVLITGDLTTTSLKEEFEQALFFVRKFEENKIAVELLPGNHDHYTKKAYAERLFYEYFPSPSSSGINVKKLTKEWWLITLDCALATSLLSSQGEFSPELEQALHEALAAIPPQQNVLIANHFPLFQQEGIRKALLRSEALRKQLSFSPQIKLYLHGHCHRHCIADLRASNLPIILDSGSTAERKGGTWNLIDLNAHGCEVQSFKHADSPSSPWQPLKKASFVW